MASATSPEARPADVRSPSWWGSLSVPAQAAVLVGGLVLPLVAVRFLALGPDRPARPKPAPVAMPEAVRLLEMRVASATPTVLAMRRGAVLLEQLSAKFSTPRDLTATTLLAALNLLEQSGIRDDPLALMEQVNGLRVLDGSYDKLADVLARYAARRNESADRATAMADAADFAR